MYAVAAKATVIGFSIDLCGKSMLCGFLPIDAIRTGLESRTDRTGGRKESHTQLGSCLVTLPTLLKLAVLLLPVLVCSGTSNETRELRSTVDIAPKGMLK